MSLHTYPCYIRTTKRDVDAPVFEHLNVDPGLLDVNRERLPFLVPGQSRVVRLLESNTEVWATYI